MLSTYVTGVLTLVLLLVAWVAVQSAWRRVFPGVSRDGDVLADRTGCHGGSCGGSCSPCEPDTPSEHSAPSR